MDPWSPPIEAGGVIELALQRLDVQEFSTIQTCPTDSPLKSVRRRSRNRDPAFMDPVSVVRMTEGDLVPRLRLPTLGAEADVMDFQVLSRRTPWHLTTVFISLEGLPLCRSTERVLI